MVRELRTDRGFSQGQLGAALGVSRQTINAIEAERYTPSLPLALSLAKFFGTSADERTASINTHAWAGVGLILTLGNVAAFIGDLASGRSGAPYYGLVLGAAIVYIMFVVFWNRHG
ncbi:helix-turn-helix transcriptional regulator [Nocardia terpenica]|uniref:Helix-turn-helix domain-containing protein n=1 Tax=Nocardia terpenica TaxID=455432 RepID=A0A6G9Z921_9NOCA|nr:helix-turn-helix domain-containing protein [Nocardia terpenica]